MRSRAFTLVELLITLSLFLVLAAIALPTIRTFLSDQKGPRTAGSVATFFNIARSRAIAEGRYVGVRIERLNPDGTGVEFGTSASIRLRQLVGVPPYTGEAANASVRITFPATPSVTSRVATLDFNSKDNLLLTLEGANAPILNGDLIELPGGRKFPLEFVSRTATIVSARIDLGAPESGSVGATESLIFPSGFQISPQNRNVKYRIHRRPSVSSAAPLSFVRGVAIDLNYSGMGLKGTEFAPSASGTSTPIDILFAPDGSVTSVTTNALGTMGSPRGLIFFCLGTSDGVKGTSDLFSTDSRAPANLMNPSSIWMVINPQTGRITTAPFASVTNTTDLPTAINQARILAAFSDTLDNQP